jgi:hypothetical protein
MNYEQSNEPDRSDAISDLSEKQERLRQAMESHPAFLHQTGQVDSEMPHTEEWEDTIGTSQPFSIDELTDDQVLAMAEQNRGGELIAARAAQIRKTARQLQNIDRSTRRHDTEVSRLRQLISETADTDQKARLRARLEFVEKRIEQRHQQTKNLRSEEQ